MRRGAIVLLLVALPVSVIAALAWGAVPLPLGVVWHALFGGSEPEALGRSIVLDVRLPRVLLAMVVGAALGTSGAALQATLRNALAEPYLLGVSGGAAVGAVVVAALGIASAIALPAAAFGGALGAVAIVMAVARAAGSRAGAGDPRVLLMAGVVVGAFANAAIMILLANAPGNAVKDALWWMMGSVAVASWDAVVWTSVAFAIAGGALLHWARDLDALALGQDTAASLGIVPEAAARRAFVVASMLAAATVAAAGLVGFVGLIVPHVARSLAGSRQRPVLAVAALAGGVLVVLADLAARTVRAPAELPLGAVTAILGVPFFLVVLRRTV
ncbi:MAG: Hemin transport system permease protein HmuU [Gemmatimonadaceae bacterium]|nr:Hemin transport system permease protein HmuU [Gemmatimonadaceae bacterium]